MNEYKNETALEPEFRKMLSMANEYFSLSTKEKCEFHQCIVLNNSLDEYRLFSFACDSVEELINQNSLILLHEKNIPVQKIICMWDSGAIDVPSHQFMKKLCELNTDNHKATVLMKNRSNVYKALPISVLLGS